MAWTSIVKICSENIALKKICLEIQENAASLCSEHQNCDENITYVEHEVEINIWNILQKQNWKLTSFYSSWQKEPLL